MMKIHNEFFHAFLTWLTSLRANIQNIQIPILVQWKLTNENMLRLEVKIHEIPSQR